MKKIKNVPLEICSAEQKIAYNLAFREHISNDKAAAELKQIDAEQNEITSKSNLSIYDLKKIDYLCNKKAAIIEKTTAATFNIFRNSPDYSTICKRYSLQDIKTAFAHGIADYLVKPFVASDYGAIGQCFWM